MCCAATRSMNYPMEVTGQQRAGWAATVGTAITLQWGVIALLAAIAWLWKGNAGAASLVFGGASVALPNSVLAAWLTVRLQQFGGAGVAALLGGELAKLGFTVALLAAAPGMLGEVSWLALVIGVVAALKAQWLALWMTRHF